MPAFVHPDEVDLRAAGLFFSDAVIKAMVLPKFNAGIEGSDEKEWTLRGANDVASLRDDLDLIVVVIVHLDDCVLDPFFEE